jgi:hypothetical protein
MTDRMILIDGDTTETTNGAKTMEGTSASIVSNTTKNLHHSQP